MPVIYFISLHRSENSIIPESDLSFDPTVALEKQLRSLLCAGFPSTPVMPKSCVILADIIKSSLLRLGDVMTRVVLLVMLALLSPPVMAEPSHIVEHIDIVEVDPQLTLTELVNQTLEVYPDYALIAALQQESDALHERGSRWVAGALNAYVYYRDDFAGSGTGAYEVDGAVAVPVWNWGQRDAGLQLAEHAEQNIAHKVLAIKLKVAGLVREAIWQLKLQELRHDIARKAYLLTERLLKTVHRRVELGDLPRADYLLAQSELLQKKTALITVEAGLMHSRKHFYFLTQANKIPADFQEVQSTKKQIDSTHPQLAALDAQIARLKSQVEWVKARGSGQTTVAIGGDTERASRSESTVNSITFNVSIPFGGNAFTAPLVAMTNKAYVRAEVAKAHVYRNLLEQLHETEHELDIERGQLEVARQMQDNALEHLKMAHLSFDAGEINLMDLLKIQARSQQSIQYAEESSLRLQRNIAFYNQAVGVMP
ncbi:TolC family protein [Methyloprofundus sp.]|uniref:TolC family protein n=1 Tax=Methyloprofundus sp. TaxID=2020875 RepID=UPI003D140E21